MKMETPCCPETFSAIYTTTSYYYTEYEYTVKTARCVEVRLKMAVLSVVVVGNFTEEEADGGDIKTDDHGKEYPLQRDEVQTTPSRDDRAKSAGASAGGPSGGADNSGSKQYIGLVIGILTAVILLLMGAIMFIVVRNRRLKSGPGHSVLPGAFGGSEKGVTINMKVSHSF
jgi:discoidin domain receptor family protein 2